MSTIVANEDILTALRTVVELPKLLVSLRLTMSVDEIPTLECTFHAERDVTNLESKAREFSHADPVTRRYRLVEILDALALE